MLNNSKNVKPFIKVILCHYKRKLLTVLDGGKQAETKDNKIQPKAALLSEGFP